MAIERAYLQAMEDQRALCHELYAVTREQLASLMTDDYERLQTLLDKRQALLDRLNPLAVFPPDNWNRFSQADQDRLTEAHAEMDRLIRETIAMDREARDRMVSHRAELLHAIREVQDGRQGLQGYRQVLAPAPQIFDHAQ